MEVGDIDRHLYGGEEKDIYIYIGRSNKRQRKCFITNAEANTFRKAYNEILLSLSVEDEVNRSSFLQPTPHINHHPNFIADFRFFSPSNDRIVCIGNVSS